MKSLSINLFELEIGSDRIFYIDEYSKLISGTITQLYHEKKHIGTKIPVIYLNDIYNIDEREVGILNALYTQYWDNGCIIAEIYPESFIATEMASQGITNISEEELNSIISQKIHEILEKMNSGSLIFQIFNIEFEENNQRYVHLIATNTSVGTEISKYLEKFNEEE